MQDPFEEIKLEVQANLKKSQALFERWKDIVHDNGSNQELTWAKSTLQGNLEQAADDVEDLEKTVKIVLNSPSSYNFSTAEINSRSAFIKDCKALIKSIRKGLRNPDIELQIKRNNRRKLMKSRQEATFKTNFDEMDEDLIQDNAEYITQKFAEQKVKTKIL